MAGQAALESRDAVRSKIRAVECNKGSSGKAPKMGKESMKTTNKK